MPPVSAPPGCMTACQSRWWPGAHTSSWSAASPRPAPCSSASAQRADRPRPRHLPRPDPRRRGPHRLLSAARRHPLALQPNPLLPGAPLLPGVPRLPGARPLLCAACRLGAPLLPGARRRLLLPAPRRQSARRLPGVRHRPLLLAGPARVVPQQGLRWQATLHTVQPTCACLPCLPACLYRSCRGPVVGQLQLQQAAAGAVGAGADPRCIMPSNRLATPAAPAR